MDNVRRRRRKKPKVHCSNNPCSRQDAELEQEVDDFLNCTAHSRKRIWHYDGKDDDDNGVDDSLIEQTKVVAQQQYPKEDVKRNSSLPVLLFSREIGFPRFEKLSRIASSVTSWKSQLLHQPIIVASRTRPRLPVTVNSLSVSQSQWNALQFSAPTYYGKYSIINSFNDRTTVPCCDGTEKRGIDKCHRADLNDVIHLQRHTWRPYTRQTIPFSKLKTPISDAILAIDRSGGYMIGIGSGDDNASEMHLSKETLLPYLSIKFYGVPSPARLRYIQDNDSDEMKSSTVSPLVHVIPLLSKKYCPIRNGISPSPSSILGDFASPVAEIPIQILLSEGGNIGVAFLRHNNVIAWSSNNAPTFSKSQDEDNLGAVVIFETPVGSMCQSESKMSKSFRLNNVSIGWWSSFTIRNALWPTNIIPVGDDENLMNSKSFDQDTIPHFLFHHFRPVLSAYMLLNDEDDGFRITWLTIDGNNESSCIATLSFSSNKIRPSRNDIVTLSEGDMWEEYWSDRSTGCVAPDDEAKPCHEGLNIAFEVYLHIDALLSDIISRRHLSLFRTSPYHNKRVQFMPEFFYNLVSTSTDTLKVVVVIVFSNKEKMLMQALKTVPSALGVFVEVNLTDQSYDELKWVQHPSCNDASSMKQWCNSLALNCRFRQCRVGVFCLENNDIGTQMESWVCGTHECNVNDDLDDDCNVKLWRDYVVRRRTLKTQGLTASPPKDISMSSLYPHCDVITNRAVHKAIPVKRITSRNSAIELIYG